MGTTVATDASLPVPGVSSRPRGPEPGDRHPHTQVAVIGAGLSGIGMAIELLHAGIEDFVILERADDIGGTWRDNTYPGIAVDVPAQAYQFSYALKPDWSKVFAEGHEVKAYIDHLADTHDVRRHVRLEHTVVSRDWDEINHMWTLNVEHGGAQEVLTARFVVSAIGAFVEPKPVDIPRIDCFAGDLLRSASWDHSVDLAGKQVGVIGTGASAVQIVPEVAGDAARLCVFQRTPIWVGPKFDPPTPRWLERLFHRVPRIQELVRRVATRGTEMALIDLVVHHRRVPWVAKGAASFLRHVWYRIQVKDPDVRRRLTPDYGLGCKRPSVSNSYLRTFNSPHVQLITDPIEQITAEGVQTVDGRIHNLDVIVLATGFRMASDPACYRDKPVRGRGGFDLADHYATHRLASYESVSLPGLPNHFMIFGPYGWTGGTWHQLVETAATHIVRVLTEAHRREATAVEVRAEAARRWTETMRSRMEQSLFATNGCATANSYYFDHHGDTPFLRPTSAASARRSASTFPLDDYTFERRPVAAR